MRSIYSPKAIESKLIASLKRFNRAFKNKLIAYAQRKLGDEEGDEVFDDEYEVALLYLLLEWASSVYQYTNRQVGQVAKLMGVQGWEFFQYQDMDSFIRQTVDDLVVDIKALHRSDIVKIRDILNQGGIVGESSESMATKIKEALSKSRNIDTIAITKTNQLTQAIAVKKYSDMGVVRGVWDARFEIKRNHRPCHVARHGKEYTIKDGLFSSCDGVTVRPGSAYRCKCSFKPIYKKG